MFDPVHIGADEFGDSVHMKVIYKNLLAAGEPGGGKSGLMNALTAHAALSARSRLVLFDGKRVELGMWDEVADEFVGPDLDHAIITLRRLQRVMDNRYAWLHARRRRKIEPADGITVITSVFDEIALYSTVLGTEAQQEEFITLFRDLVARGRAAAMPVIAATQRPSVDIIPKSLRDLFGYRAAFRCTSDGSSDIILGDGWSGAASPPPTSPRPTGAVPPDRRRRHPPPRQGRLPHRRPHHRPGRPRQPGSAEPATPPRPGTSHRRRLTTTAKGTSHVQHRPRRAPGVHHQPARPGRLPRPPAGHPGPHLRHNDPAAPRRRRPRRPCSRSTPSPN